MIHFLVKGGSLPLPPHPPDSCTNADDQKWVTDGPFMSWSIGLAGRVDDEHSYGEEVARRPSTRVTTVSSVARRVRGGW